MIISCPKCNRELEVERSAAVIPPHVKLPRAGLLDNEAMVIDGEPVVVTLLKMCRLSGAEFRRVA